GDERAAERHALEHAAGKRGDGRAAVEAERVQRLLDARVEAPAVGVLKLVLQRVQPLQRFGARRRAQARYQIVIRDELRGDLSQAARDGVVHVLLGRQLRLLRHQRDARAGLDAKLAVV